MNQTNEPLAQALRPLPSYPHMMPADAELWTRYLQRNPHPDANVIYDLHVGTPAIIPGNLSQNWRTMIEALSTKRIDAIILTPSHTVVLEIKPYAGLSSIGQALSYLHLVKRQHPNLPNPIAAILTDHAQPDVPEICAIYNITLFQLD